MLIVSAINEKREKLMNQVCIDKKNNTNERETTLGIVYT